MIFANFHGSAAAPSLIGPQPSPGLAGGATAVGGAVGVKTLQEQLRRIAYENGQSSIDPASYDGTMTLGTIMALANAAPFIGDKIHPVVGHVLDVVGLLKKPTSLIPYGDTVINLVLSPWIIDHVYDSILAIIRLIPGGGGAASAIDTGMKSVKEALTLAAAPLAAALMLVKKSSGFGALGAALPGFCWIPATATVTGHWERMRVGQTACASPPPAGAAVPVVRDQRTGTGTSAAGGITVTDASGTVVRTRTALPPPISGLPGVVRDHRTWPEHKKIIDTDWGRRNTYYGKAGQALLHPDDFQAWASKRGDTAVRYGVKAFKTFTGRYVEAAFMGAFFDERNDMLKIIVVPEPQDSSGAWDFVTDIVDDAVDAVGDAAGAIADIAQDTWNWIAANADDVYRAVKKYGCMIVNNDIVVALAAAGTGIVATPAASATVIAAAAEGRAACAVMEIAEVLYAIYKLLAMDFPKPPPLTAPTPPSVKTPSYIVNNVMVNGLHVMMPPTPPVVPLAKSRYPEGTIAAFDEKLQRYRIAIPIGTQLPTQLGDGAFGAAATHFEVAQTSSAPPQVPIVPLTPFQKQTNTLPLYKQPLFWGAIGASAAVVGGGGYALYRRRRRLTT